MTALIGLSLADLRDLITGCARSLPREDLVWASGNRDYAETHRYDAKDLVDDSLSESSTVSGERSLIEALFSDQPDPELAAEAYVGLLQTRVRHLHAAHTTALTQLSAVTMRPLWLEICHAADIDNAHAMYLSSDNWPFSVFHACVGVLEELCDGDARALASILTNGELDVRTASWGGLGARYVGMNRDAYVELILRQGDWIRDDGVVPLVSFESASAVRPARLPDAAALRGRYLAAKHTIEGRLSPRARPLWDANLHAFSRLSAARRAYDAYEYFGSYALMRHLIILRTMTLLDSIGADGAGFQQAASIYRFQEIARRAETWA